MLFMINEAKFIEREITLRNMSLTKEVLETRRSLIRWLALALGVINPGESRQQMLPVLDAIMHFQFVQRKDPRVDELMDYIEKHWAQINEKTLRYHLLQLKKAKIVNNSKGRYFLTQPSIGDRYDEESWVNSYLSSEINPIKEKVVIAIKGLKSR
ncbi:MAG: hypothetical protein KGH98_01735 [Candidatus Micrarchaeota archaeon]|nr:hypothetical protein [Candidatus Micrarchaeota archaeon]